MPMKKIKIDEDELHIEKGLMHREESANWFDLTIDKIKTQNEPDFIIARIRDVTEKKHIADIKNNLQEKFQSIFKYSRIGIALVDELGKPFMSNAALQEFLGYSGVELSGMTFAQFTYPEDVEKDVEQYTQLLNGEIDHYRMEKRYIHKNGGIVWASLTVSLVKKHSRAFALGMVEDITNKKNAELSLRAYQTELIDLVKELKAANKNLELFAFSISHDLRAPLRYIRSFSTILQRTVKDLTPKSIRHLDNIITGVDNMSNMIDALLEFSRLGRQELKKEEIKLNDLISEIIQEKSVMFENRQIEWSIGDMPNIHGDYQLMKMVFYNLISNALKFTKNKDKTIIEIAVKNQNLSNTTIYIKDNGIGFDMQYSSKLFGVFQRLHHQEDFEGYGIGMANVKRIMDRHQASIFAYGKLHEGATFYLKFKNKKDE